MGYNDDVICGGGGGCRMILYGVDVRKEKEKRKANDDMGNVESYHSIAPASSLLP